MRLECRETKLLSRIKRAETRERDKQPQRRHSRTLYLNCLFVGLAFHSSILLWGEEPQSNP